MQHKLFCSIKCYSYRYTVVNRELEGHTMLPLHCKLGKSPPTCRTVKLHACVFYNMLPLLRSDVLHRHPQCLVFPLSGPRLRVLLCHLLSLSLLCPFDILCVAAVSTCLETLPLYTWFSFLGMSLSSWSVLISSGASDSTDGIPNQFFFLHPVLMFTLIIGDETEKRVLHYRK